MTREEYLVHTPWNENEDKSVADFFQSHAAELASFFASEGIDNKSLIEALREHKASEHVLDLVRKMEIEEDKAQENAKKRSLDQMATLSRALRVAARERGALSDFKSVFSAQK